MRTMSPRETHANNLACISELSDSPYYRRMSFVEADSWLFAYEDMVSKGYPRQMAAQRAWDCHFASRNAFAKGWRF